MVIVVVADMDKSTIENKVKSFWQKYLQVHPFVAKEGDLYSAGLNAFKSEKRGRMPLNYVMGITAAPLARYTRLQCLFPGHESLLKPSLPWKSEVRMDCLMLPEHWLTTGNATYSNIYVTTTEPDKYIAVARRLVDSIKQNGFTESELKNEKTGYLTGLYYRDETNQARANSLASNEVVHGDWKRSIKIKDDINKVTLTQLNSVFKNILIISAGYTRVIPKR